ncbi:hypothetical protein DIU36_10280 [Mucilaginibacter rubeus]|nr:hypothetical protein DIU36_10280 [Mucilaginibacter rubeus]
MNKNKAALIILFLLPPEFWNAVVSHYLPWLQAVLSIICSTGKVLSFMLVAFVLFFNLFITSLITWFKNNGLNGLLIFFLMMWIGCLACTLLKIKKINLILQRVFSRRSSHRVTNTLRQIIGKLLLIAAGTIILLRAISTIMSYIVNARQKSKV